MKYSYYQRNREKRKKYNRDYYSKIKDSKEYKEKIKLYLEKYKVRRKELNDKYYDINKEKIKKNNTEYRKKNSVTVKKKDILRAHKISDDFYQNLIDNAGGKCAICNSSANLYIDHDHIRGEVRGMLCRECNLGLGFFKDNVESIKNAVTYLQEWRHLELAPKLNIKKGDINS